MMNNICEICKEPMLIGQAVHGASGNHFNCESEKKQLERETFIRSFFTFSRKQQEEMLRKILERQWK